MRKRTFCKVLFFISCTVLYFHATAVKSYASHRIIDAEEAVLVIGGGGAVTAVQNVFKPSSNPAPVTQKVDITLGGVPYVSQYMSYVTVDNRRDDFFCGIASAMMVRMKGKRTDNSPPLNSRSSVETDMMWIDNNLRYNRTYGSIIDVSNNKGLLYISDFESDEEQYKKTESVIRRLYTAKKTDGVHNDNGNVTDIKVQIIKATNNEAINIIFNHVNNNRQPAVVVVDNSIVDEVLYNSKYVVNYYRNTTPVLHYLVVIGVFENTPGGIKNFRIYDPAWVNLPREFTETQLSSVMRMPSNNSWVYKYPSDKLNMSDPCYIGLVQGE